MSFVDIGNGERSVSFNPFAQDIINSKKENGLEFSDWTIDDCGRWKVYVKPLDRFVFGDSINSCIELANSELRQTRGKSDETS